MTLNKKQQITELLKGIESGNPSVVSVVNEEKYIQHNPQTHKPTNPQTHKPTNPQTHKLTKAVKA